jgi:hypothetical protein
VNNSTNNGGYLHPDQPIDTATLRAAFVQAQAQIMNNGEYTPVVVIDKGLALQLLDEIDFLERLVMNVAMRCVREPDVAAEMVADERERMQS